MAGNGKIFRAYKELKMRYSTPEDSFRWWELNSGRPELGVLSIDTRTKKARFRASDDTPSVAFYKYLSYVDFGADGQSKDPVDRIMEVTGATPLEAAKMVLEWEGQNPEDLEIQNHPAFREPQKEKKGFRPPYSPKYLKELQTNRCLYQDRYLKVAKGLFRAVTEVEREFAEHILSIGFLPKKEKNHVDRVFVPEFDEKGVPWGSYAYNREGTPKGLLRKNAKRVLFGSHLLAKYPQTVFFTEGHTDAINLIAKKVPAVTTGSSTTKIGEHIKLLAGRKILFFPDLDVPGMKGVTKKAMEIEEWNKKASPEDRIEYTIFWWADWMYSKDLLEKILSGSVSKSERDLLILSKIGARKKGHLLVNKEMFRVIQEDFLYRFPEYARHPKIDIRSWTVVHKNASRKKGYDFVDRMQEGDFASKIVFEA